MKGNPADPRPGDLVFFGTDPADPDRAATVCIVTGDGGLSVHYPPSPCERALLASFRCKAVREYLLGKEGKD